MIYWIQDQEWSGWLWKDD